MRVDLDAADLADHDAGQQRADDVAQRERAEAQPADLESDRERQEDGELGVLPQRGEQHGSITA